MPTPFELAALVAAIASGLIAGLCFSFASFLLGAFDRLAPAEAIRVMQAINTRILRSSAMVVWFGALVVGAVAIFLAEGIEQRTLASVSTVLYGVGAIVITGRGNVPLNDELGRVDSTAAGAEEAWRRYRRRWGLWNMLRTVVCALASFGFALSS